MLAYYYNLSAWDGMMIGLAFGAAMFAVQWMISLASKKKDKRFDELQRQIWELQNQVHSLEAERR